jgi:hypothetical protein
VMLMKLFYLIQSQFTYFAFFVDHAHVFRAISARIRRSLAI